MKCVCVCVCIKECHKSVRAVLTFCVITCINDQACNKFVCVCVCTGVCVCVRCWQQFGRLDRVGQQEFSSLSWVERSEREREEKGRAGDNV